MEKVRIGGTEVPARVDACDRILTADVEPGPEGLELIALAVPGAKAVMTNSGGDEFEGRVVITDPDAFAVTVEI